MNQNLVNNVCSFSKIIVLIFWVPLNNIHTYYLGKVSNVSNCKYDLVPN